MNTINIITNEMKYSNEIVKLAESILDKSTNNNVRINATTCLVELYSKFINFSFKLNIKCSWIIDNLKNNKTLEIISSDYARESLLVG